MQISMRFILYNFPGIFLKGAQFDYTVSPRLQEDFLHISVVRGRMTRNINVRLLDVLEEIDLVLGGFVSEADHQGVC
jgi:hypothetical protein